MKEYSIQSDRLKIAVSENGAELTGITDLETGFNFLWDANKEVWGRHAPVLFPIVGKLNNNSIKINNSVFEMGQHGFARDMKFEPVEIYPDYLKFMLESNEETLIRYPFPFKLFVGYSLENNIIQVEYTIMNTGTDNMYYSIGAHPGFKLPVADLGDFHLEFEKPESFESYLLLNGCFTGDSKKLGEGNRLDLNEHTFSNDALVFKALKSNWISLKHNSSSFEVKMDFHEFPYLGIWGKFPDQSFVCLEPWAGLADSIGFSNDISKKEGIRLLSPEATETFTFSIEFIA